MTPRTTIQVMRIIAGLLSLSVSFSPSVSTSLSLCLCLCVCLCVCLFLSVCLYFWRILMKQPRNCSQRHGVGSWSVRKKSLAIMSDRRTAIQKGMSRCQTWEASSARLPWCELPAWPKEVDEFVRKSRAKSAQGGDGVSYKVSTYCDKLEHTLFEMLRDLWKDKEIVNDWCTAEGVCLPKEQNVENNRVIWTSSTWHARFSQEFLQRGLEMLLRSADCHEEKAKVRSPKKAFMDDVTLLTRDVDTKLITWSRMKFKAKKSRSLTIHKAKQRQQKFTIAGGQMPTVKEQPVKSLGRWYAGTLSDRSQNVATMQQAEDGLKAIDQTKLPGKHKIWCLQFAL